MVSGDRDLLQLVRDDPPAVRLLFTVRGVSDLHEFDEAAVLAKYGVPASRYAEFAILRGDPSDELPGVPGVGEKTARALIIAYDSFDALMADAASDAPPQPGPFKGSPKLRARVRAGGSLSDGHAHARARERRRAHDDVVGNARRCRTAGSRRADGTARARATPDGRPRPHRLMGSV